MSSEGSERPEQPEYRPRQRIRRIVIVFTPLMFAALALVGWRLVGGANTAGEEVIVAPAATITATIASATPEASDPPGDGIGRVVGPATPWAVNGEVETDETPSPADQTSLSPVEVQGPPAGSVFRQSDMISFYWQWPEELGQDQRFALYLAVGDARLLLGTVDQANLGQGYQLRAVVGELVGEAGSFSWQVELENENDGATLAQSQARLLTIIAE